MNQWTWNHVLAIMTIENTCLSGSFKVYMHSNPVIYFSVQCITNFHQNCAKNGQCIFGSFIPIYYHLLFFFSQVLSGPSVRIILFTIICNSSTWIRYLMEYHVALRKFRTDFERTCWNNVRFRPDTVILLSNPRNYR